MAEQPGRAGFSPTFPFPGPRRRGACPESTSSKVGMLAGHRRPRSQPVPAPAASSAGGTEPGAPDGPVGAAGLKASLERLQLEYVDVVFANRPDPNTPMEGGCRAAVPRSSLLPFVAIVVGLRQAFIRRAFSLPEQKPLLCRHGQPALWLSLRHPSPALGPPHRAAAGWVGVTAAGRCPRPSSTLPATADSALSKSLFYHQGTHLVPPSPGVSSWKVLPARTLPAAAACVPAALPGAEPPLPVTSIPSPPAPSNPCHQCTTKPTPPSL